jgi:hypothetical protein
MKRIALTALLMAFGCTIGPDHVYGANGHVYNGSYCGPYYGVQQSSFEHEYFGLENISGSSLYASCPVLQDEIGTLKGTTQTWVHYTGDGDVSCVILNLNGNGTVRETRSAGRNGTGWFAIANLTTDDFYGSYSAYCLIPSGGVLNTFFLDEADS